jgi:hypothetical protein
MNEEPIFIDEVGWHERFDKGSAAVYEDVLAGFLFQLGDFFDDVSFDDC